MPQTCRHSTHLGNYLINDPFSFPQLHQPRYSPAAALHVRVLAVVLQPPVAQRVLGVGEGLQEKTPQGGAVRGHVSNAGASFRGFVWISVQNLNSEVKKSLNQLSRTGGAQSVLARGLLCCTSGCAGDHLGALGGADPCQVPILSSPRGPQPTLRSRQG